MLPRNLAVAAMCEIRSGTKPISLAQVASAATGSSNEVYRDVSPGAHFERIIMLMW